MDTKNLKQLGWQPFFQQQLSLDEWENCTPVRVIDFQRSVFSVQSDAARLSVAITADMPPITVGDWVLLDGDEKFVRLLDRGSVFQRKAAGSRIESQLIAANIDTVFIVSSMNQDFSLNRIERYLALANEAKVEPVVVLSKADLCGTPDDFVAPVQRLDPLLMVVPINGLDTISVAALTPWCVSGKTVAVMGSSGVGKSTLINTLLGHQAQITAAIRDADDEGRHTTTSRSMHAMAEGGWLLDTPGMRELQLTDCETGLEMTFGDIAELALNCRFHDCQHQGEPGCAVMVAIDKGDLEERRLQSYRKLMREQALNSATLKEKHDRDRKLGKMYRNAQEAKGRRK